MKTTYKNLFKKVFSAVCLICAFNSAYADAGFSFSLATGIPVGKYGLLGAAAHEMASSNESAEEVELTAEEKEALVLYTTMVSLICVVVLAGLVLSMAKDDRK